MKDLNQKIDNIVLISGKLLQKASKRNLFQFQVILLQFVERIHLNFLAIKPILTLYENESSKFKLPILILIRTLLADYLLCTSLIKELKFEDSQFNEKKILELFNELTGSSLESVLKSNSIYDDNSIDKVTMVEALRNLKEVKRELLPRKFLDNSKNP